MFSRVRVKAPAKLNLHLEVFGRREDGYHDLSGIMQLVGLFDEIDVGSLKDTDSIEIHGDFDCPEEQNTMYRAVVEYRRATGLVSGVRIGAVKRIPARAGLGGGSSDAAAVLRALDAVYGTCTDASLLSRIARKIGSDVPFFLGSSAAAIVAGTGESVVPIRARTDFGLLLVFPPFGIGTAWAFRRLDESRQDTVPVRACDEGTLERIYGTDPESWSFTNDFMEAVSGTFPGMAVIVSELRNAGARFVSMSGSGSTLFGVFPDRTSAAEAGASLDTGRYSMLSGSGPAGCIRWIAVDPLVSPSPVSYY